MKRLYFAHPINTYGTPLERELLTLIAQKFPYGHYEVVNPSDQIHKDVVAKLREKDPKANVMPYFEELTASCDELVALPFGDCMLGAGVWAEAQKMLDNGGGGVVHHAEKSQNTSFGHSSTLETHRRRNRHKVHKSSLNLTFLSCG